MNNSLKFPHFPIPQNRLSNALLFQLLLSQLLKFYQSFSELKAHIATTPQDLSIIKEYFKILLDNPQFTIAPESPSWNTNQGSLKKLQNLSYSLVQDGTLDQEITTKLHEKFSKALTEGQKCWDSLFQKNTINKELFEKCNRYLDRSLNLVKKLLIHFQDDENVLFFLLRHSETFDLMYNSQFTISFLQKIYGKNLENIEKQLKEKFSNRRFEHLFTIISEKMKKIESNQTTTSVK